MALWGEHEWGTFKWGDDADTPTDQQGAEPGAKQDTYYLGKSDGQAAASNFTDFATDRSGYGTSFVTTSGHPEATADWLPVFPGAVEFRAGITSTDTGTLLSADDGANSIKLVLATGGVITPTINGVADTNGQVTIPGLTGSEQRCVVAWITERDRDGNDDMRSYLCVWNTATGQFDMAVWDHSDISPALSGATLGIWGDGGASIFSGTAYVARVSRRFHSPTEVKEDWVEVSYPLNPTGEKRVEPLVPDRDSGFGDVGEFVGPPESIVASGIHQADLRLAGPMVNENYNDAPTWDSNYAPDQWDRAMPLNTTVFLMGNYLVWTPRHRGINAWKARVFVSAVDGVSTGTLEVVCVCFNKIPNNGVLVLNGPTPPSYDHRYVTQTLSLTTTLSEQWVDFSDAIRRLVDDGQGGCYFALGFLASTNALWNVHSWHVDSILDKTTNGIMGGEALQP